jgi:neprilysin
VTSFSVIDNKLREQLRTIINEPIQENEIEPFKNVKRLYQACNNVETIEQLGVAPVKDAIDAIGGWPVERGDAWNTPDTWTWEVAMANSIQSGYSASYIFSLSVSTDNKNTLRRIVRVRRLFNCDCHAGT